MVNKIDWANIDTVLLDMDGTLIDQHYEDYFWETLAPKAYAKKNKITLKKSREILFSKYHERMGHPEWGDVNFWSKELGLDLWKIRDKAKYLIKLHPHTMRFLDFLKKHGKKVYLVTAADNKSTKYKIAHTKIGNYFDGIFTQTDIGYTKCNTMFWKKLQRKVKFNPERALFADDREDMIKAAGEFGIRCVVLKVKYSSRKPNRNSNGLFYVRHFDEIL
ncbi:MAG: HAD-IA family hydrolase [Candidatus Aenigmatarchaeota archaeon]